MNILFFPLRHDGLFCHLKAIKHHFCTSYTKRLFSIWSVSLSKAYSCLMQMKQKKIQIQQRALFFFFFHYTSHFAIHNAQHFIFSVTLG